MRTLNNNKKLIEIRNEIENLKKRLNNVEGILNSQEELLDLLTQSTKSLLIDAFGTPNTTSHEAIMKMAFTKGKIPKILNR